MAKRSADIREMTDEELSRGMEENRRELLNLRLQLQTGQLENTARVRTVRREYARLRTEETVRQARHVADDAQ